MNGATPSRRGDHYHTAAGRGHGKLARLPALGRPTATLTLMHVIVCECLTPVPVRLLSQMRSTPRYRSASRALSGAGGHASHHFASTPRQTHRPHRPQ